MFDTAFKSDHGTVVGGAHRTPRNSILGASVLSLLLGLIGAAGAAANTNIQNDPVTTARPGLPFAIADFDGDTRPDLASVQSSANSPGNTDYRIQLQLSAVGQQSIELVAPAGGLRIEARDVNGDHAVDLVLTTAWFREPVAIYLNDGHGRFSRAKPDAFPRAFRGSKKNWTSTTDLATDAVGVPPQSGAGIRAAESDSLHDKTPQRLIPPSSAGFSINPFLISQPGRAPPSEVFYL
jgi:hypothetical protein